MKIDMSILTIGGRKMDTTWATVNSSIGINALETLPHERIYKVKAMIRKCIDVNMEIPKERIEEYSELIKEE